MAVRRPQTKTEQIIEALRSKIDSEDYSVGEPIPSTSQLEAQFGASKTAVTAAVRELKQRGYLEGKPGKGVYVAATSSEMEEQQTDLGRLEEGLRSLREEIEQIKASPSSDDGLRREVEVLRDMVVRLYSHLMDLYNRLGAKQPEDAKRLLDGLGESGNRAAS